MRKAIITYTAVRVIDFDPAKYFDSQPSPSEEETQRVADCIREAVLQDPGPFLNLPAAEFSDAASVVVVEV